MLALMRLQWWREVVEGQAKAHEIATPLYAALAEGRLDRADLLAMIAGRETETYEEGILTQDAWFAYLTSTAGQLALAAGRVLGAADPALLFWGAQYGAAGVLRSVPALARQGRCLLPQDILMELEGLSTDEVIAGSADPQQLRLVISYLADHALDQDEGHPLPARAAIPAALVGVYAGRDLVRLAQGRSVPTQRGILDRWALIWAGLRGKI